MLLGVSSRPPALQNALGVCRVRLAEAARAIDLYREMVLLQGGIGFRSDADFGALTKFATALLLSGNVAGGPSFLDEHKQPNGQGVYRLHQGIANWKRPPGAFRRFLVAVIGPPDDARVPFGFAPGEIRATRRSFDVE